MLFKVMFRPLFSALLKHNLHILKHPNIKVTSIATLYTHKYTFTLHIHRRIYTYIHTYAPKHTLTHIDIRPKYKAFLALQQTHLCSLIINNFSPNATTVLTSIFRDQICPFSISYILNQSACTLQCLASFAPHYFYGIYSYSSVFSFIAMWYSII